MTFITALVTGIIIGGVAVRIAYRRHIAIAQEVITEELARMWVERNNVDARF